ncbi:MAG: protein phosphatase 2C domain-containing protein [Isosphaeraceae bacterium]|nr:protein phosphatase 2C domain-containing protein [Isosphaeraceae bacterium]
MNWDDIIEDAAATDTGMRRSNNQDCHAIVRASGAESWKQRGHLFVVADGMGAHAVGELASKMACDNIPHHYLKNKTAPPAEAITKAYKDVGMMIHSKASANRDFQGMGTTCSTLILRPEGALIAHIGDSRVYRVRENRIDQLSFDHSLAWELVRRKHLTPEQAQKAVPRNVITRSLGPDPHLEVDIEGPLPVAPGDVFLLCSDGLSGPVTDPEIGLFAGNLPPKDAARYLVHFANLRGGLDNITVVVARIGAWVDPDSNQELPRVDPTAAGDARSGGGIGRALAGLFGGKRKAEPAPVEEHRYQTAECGFSNELLGRVNDLVAHSQNVAVEQAWHLDWPSLTGLRRQTKEALEQSKPHRALRSLGESMVILGTAGRQHKKAKAGNGTH